jgi:hypothetical protein
MIVAHTGLILALFVPNGLTGAAEAVCRKDPEWRAPESWRREFGASLARRVRRRAFAPAQACRIMDEAARFMAGREHRDPVRLPPIVTARTRIPAGAGEFIRLARRLRCPLVTPNRAILAAFPQTAVDPEGFLRG